MPSQAPIVPGTVAGADVVVPYEGRVDGRRRPSTPDAVSILTIWLLLLLGVPSGLTFSGLGSLGHPSTVWGLGCAVWWCWYTLQRTRPTAPFPQPVRTATFVLLAACLVSYVAAATRPLPLTEASTADSGLLRMLSWTGILLVANDGIADLDRLHALLRRIVTLGSAFALVGLLQFATGQALVDAISFPGMSISPFSGPQARNGFLRSSSTAMHPLEYGSVLAMTFPIAVTLALQATHGVVRRWTHVAVLALACAVSVSRSALVGLAAALAFLAPAWPRTTRRIGAAVAAAAAVAIYVLVPGMVGTIIGMFTGISEDSSAASRVGSYELAADFFARGPLFGRGFGTFLPEYRILDNQYLQLLIEMGVVGLAAFLAVVLSAIGGGVVVRRRSVESTIGQLGQALAASLFAGSLLFAFFDGMSFPKAVGLLFLVAGACGAHWRLVREEGLLAPSPRIPSRSGGLS